MRRLAFGLALTLLVAVASPARAATIFYTDLVAFNGASSTTLVEDFESFSPLNTGLPSFVLGGNTYTGLAGTPGPNVYVSAAGFTNYGVPVTTSNVLTANGDEDFTVDFGAPSTALGFDTYLNGRGPGTLSVFGASGLLGTFNLNHHAANVVGFLGVTATESILSIRWTTTGGGVINTGIDNIVQGRSLVPVPVPEPSALLLLGTGLVGLIVRRRMKARG